jgi:hypothetical protein
MIARRRYLLRIKTLPPDLLVIDLNRQESEIGIVDGTQDAMMASREVEIMVVVLARLKIGDRGRFDQRDLLFERRPIRRRLSMSRQSLISRDLDRHASHQEVGYAVVERVSNHEGFVAGAALTSFLTLTRARGAEWASVSADLRGSLATRGVAPKQHRVAPACFLSGIFRAGSLDPLIIPWRVGAEESGAAKYGFGRRDAARPARAAWI